nr:ABC transporter substrate-binding protein [Methanotorris formicicus]
MQNETKTEIPTLKVAYLPTDHHAALFVAAKEGNLFKDKYGIYMKEIEPKKKYELYENGKKVADVELVQVVEGGAKIMTLMAQNQIDIGLNGVPPAVFAIDKGTKAKIISALQGEGSAVVVRKDIPVNNWKEFIDWIKEQHAKGEQVRIGHPLPVSIQYVMIQKALEAEGITYTENKDDKDAMVLLVNCKGQKSMPQMLSQKELDAVIAWEPMPEVLKTQNIGKPIIYSGELPPNSMWKNHPCCVVVASEDALNNKRDAVKAFLKLIVLATKEINENKELAIKDSAEWLGVNEKVEEESIPHLKFDTNPEPLKEGAYVFVNVMNKQGAMDGKLKGVSDKNEIDNILFDFSIYNEIMKELNK